MVDQLVWDLRFHRGLCERIVGVGLVVIERVKKMGFTACVYCIVEEGDGGEMRLGRMEAGG